MKFSVLIPVYNTEEYLEECLRSVLDQTYSDFEIILVDDGSTDGSPAICDKYASEYPDIVRVIHKENQGLISARRVGIAEALGDFIIFVDSDDRVSTELLEVVFAEIVKDTSVDIVLYSFRYARNGVPLKSYHRFANDGETWTDENKRDIYERLLFSNDVTPMWIKAVRASIAKSDPMDYTLYYGKNMAEDKLQSLYLLTVAGKIKYIYAPLYFYNYNDQSISRNYSIDSIRKMNTIHVYEKIKEFLPLWGMDSKETINRLDAVWFDNTMYQFRKAYESAATRKDRKTVLSFDWDSMIPCLDVDSYKNNVGKLYLKLYNWNKNKNYCALRTFFLKNKIYSKYKKLKNKNEY